MHQIKKSGNLLTQINRSFRIICIVRIIRISCLVKQKGIYYVQTLLY